MKRRVSIYLMLLAVFVMAQPVLAQTFGATLIFYGDPNVEQWTGTIGGGLVQAYTMITVDAPTVLRSVSMFLQYSGSDGSQCMYFGIYQDNGSGSPAGQPLVSATKWAYCLRSAATWGPAWQTWRLRPSDYMTILTPGTYWLCTLASQTYGTIYHYSYAGAYDYTYGYYDYYFVATFANGFPQFFSPTPASETNGPYSFYATGTTL
jgi:hypothetical protein